MSELYATLLSWAVTLSGYPAPGDSVFYGATIRYTCSGNCTP